VVDVTHPGDPAATSVTVIAIAEDLAETARHVESAARALTVAHSLAGRLARTSSRTSSGRTTGRTGIRGAGEW
jgi:hypothetical protein